MSRRRLTATVAALTLAIAAGVGARGFLLPGLCDWLDVGQAPQCADHVLLLPGDETYRPVTAAALVKAGFAKDVLIPETYAGADVTDGVRPPAWEVLSRVVQHRGIPEENIVCLPGASRTTFDDAHALLAFVNTRTDDRVIVVTNAYHTRRARFIFRRVWGVAADRLQFVAAPNPGFTEGTWWQNRSSTNAVLSENLKLGFYVFRYSRLYGWVGSLLLIGAFWLCCQGLWKRRAAHEAQTGRLAGSVEGPPGKGWRVVRRDAR